MWLHISSRSTSQRVKKDICSIWCVCYIRPYTCIRQSCLFSETLSLSREELGFNYSRSVKDGVPKPAPAPLCFCLQARQFSNLCNWECINCQLAQCRVPRKNLVFGTDIKMRLKLVPPRQPQRKSTLLYCHC